MEEKKPRYKEIVEEIEKKVPEDFTQPLGIIVSNDLDQIIIKNGKVCIGKTTEDCTPVDEALKRINKADIINGLLLAQQMISELVEPVKEEPDPLD